MKQFNKSSKLDHVSYDVRGPVVEEAARMSAQNIRILKLNIGNPANNATIAILIVPTTKLVTKVSKYIISK